MARGTAETTRQSILNAARELLRAGGREPTVGEIAGRARVSRLSVYHHFGSRAGVLAAVAGGAARLGQAGSVRDLISQAVTHWAGDPSLFRRLPASDDGGPLHHVATSLAAEDRLRPGCSLREAEDVLGVLTSFAVFDRLHQDGRRSTQAVTEILVRMAGSILGSPP